MAELGVGYISILPEVSGISGPVARALDGLDPVAERSGKSMGSKMSSGIGTALKVTSAGVGLAAGGLLATSFSKGLGRLTSIDDAQAKLRGLGHDTQGTAVIMDSALASVRGTAYGLGDAAGLAAGAVAAGIKPGQELTKYLTMTADAAAIAGTDLSEMGSIINQVQTGQVAYTDNLNQLADRGVPVYSWLAEEAGVALGDVKKLASEGKISSEMFFAAIEKNIGGAAQEMGNSVSGSAANAGAALGRLGATALAPFFDLAVDGFGAATSGIDAFEGKIAPLAASTGEWLQGTAVPGLIAFKDNALAAWDAMRGNADVQSLLSQTGIIIGDMVSTGRDLVPVMGQAASAIGQASAALGVGTWQLALVGLEGIGTAAKLVVPPLELITGFMQDHPSVVTAAVAAYAGFKTLPGIMDRINPVVSKISEGAKTGTSTVKLFGSSFGEAYGYMRQANPEMGRAGAAMRVIGGEGGVAAAGMDKMKGAANGVMGLFGGPWGLALAAAGVVVTGVVQANQKAEVAQENMAKAARDSASAQIELRAAVAGTTGVLDEQAVAAAARVAGNSLAEFVEQGEAVSGMMWKVQTDATLLERAFQHMDYQADVQATRDLRDAYKALSGAMEELGLPMEDLNQVVAEGGAEYAALMGTLRSMGDEGNAAADKLEATRTTLDGLINDARALDPAVAQAAAAIDILADSSGNANDKLGALESLMQAMGLAPKDAEAAMMDAAAAVDEIVEAATGAERPFEQMGDALFGIEGKLDPTNEGARDLAGTLNGLRGELQNVAVNGGDVWGAFDGMAPALKAIQEEFGLTDEQVRQLQQSFGLMPQEIITAVALEGASEAVQQLGDVWAAVESLPAGEQIEISALTSDAQAALELAGYAVEKIPGSTNVLISADTEGAQGRLADVIRQMADMDGLEVSPELFLNDRQLVDSAANAQGILDALAIQTPTPEAKIIIDQLLSGVDISQGQLNFLATQTPTPVADLERSLLANGVTVSSQLLNELHNQPTRPMIDANAAPLFGGVDQAKLKLNELQDKTVDIRIREWREYYSSGAATSTGGTAVGQHYGATGGRFDPKEGFAYLPAYVMGGRHDGYRLPSSGPGTERTDGFLAVDSTGTPVAHLDKDEWVVNGRSSEKYNRVIGMINRDDPSVQHLAKYEDGGRVGRPADEVMRFARGERVDGHQASRSLESAPYVWAGINWGDCSAAIAALARFAVGLAPFAARFATGNQREALASMSFENGLGGPNDFNIGWFNGGSYGGHTSATIAGTNVEMGGIRGNGQIGGGAAPASHPQYTGHAHLKLGSGSGISDAFAVDPGLQWQPTGGDQLVQNAGTSDRLAEADTPASWSGIAGDAAQNAVSGQVRDALGVFGLSDSPGFLGASAEFAQASGGMGIGGVLQDALLAVVGDRALPAVLPQAVTSMLAMIPAFRDGGWVSAPGGPRDDLGLARVSDEEFIVNAGAAQRNRALLEHLNSGGDVAPASRGGDTFNIQGADAGEVMRRMKAEMMAKTMQLMGG